jgi:hypothetical protein
MSAPGSALMKSLGTGAGGEPIAVGRHDFGDVGGFAVDRDLAGPGQCGTPSLAALGEGPPVLGHFLVAQLTQRPCR